MMLAQIYRADAFRAFAAAALQPNVINTYSSFVRRIDQAIGGLDEALSQRGAAASVLAWAETTNEPPLNVYCSSGKSALRQYLCFASNEPANDDETSAEIAREEEAEAVTAAFGLERTMQAAVRRSIDNLEHGITIIDQGTERTVATGKIDILARDGSNVLTVIELKAGLPGRCG